MEAPVFCNCCSCCCGVCVSQCPQEAFVLVPDLGKDGPLEIQKINAHNARVIKRHEEVDPVILRDDAYKIRDPNPTYRRGFARPIKGLAAGKSGLVTVGAQRKAQTQTAPKGEGLLDWLAWQTSVAESGHF